MYQIGIDPSRTSATPEWTPGTEAMIATTSGMKGYIYAQAVATTAIGDVLLLGATYAATLATLTTTTPGDAAGRRVGVAVAAMAANEYGWLQIKGVSAVNVAASCVRNTVLNTTATGGRLDDDATAGAEVIDGCTLTTTASGAAVTAAMLNYPYVGRTL